MSNIILSTASRRNAFNGKRLLRLSLFLTSATIGCGFVGQAGAQTLDLGGATVNRADLDAAPADQYEIVENGVLRLDPVPPLTYNGLLRDGAGTLALELNSSSLTLGGNNSYTGGTTVNGGTLTVANNNAAGTGTIAFANLTGLAAGTSGLTIANAVQTNGAVSVDSGPGVFALNGAIGGAGSIVAIGTGNLILNGNNSFGGGLGISQGTVTLGTNNAAGTGGIAILFDGALAAGVSGLTIANDIQILDTGRIDSGTGVFTLNGIIGGAGSVTSIGTGNLVLNGNNSFAGGLTVAGGLSEFGFNTGRVTLGTSTAAGTGTITITDGTTLAAGVDGLVLTNAIQTTGGARINGGAGVMTLNGDISGVGDIFSDGTGNLILNGNNSFANGLNIGGGTVTLGNNNAAGTGEILFFGGGTLAAGVSGLALANDIRTNGVSSFAIGLGPGSVMTLNGDIVGGGSIRQLGSGNLILNGNNSFTGGLTILGGTEGVGFTVGGVTLGTNTAAGTGTITIGGGATLTAGANNLVLANAIETLGTGFIAVDTNMLTLDGDISGAGSIGMVGSGDLVLNGNNSYAGGTTVAGGRLTLGTNTAAGTGTIQFYYYGGLRAGVSGLVVENDINIDRLNSNGLLSIDSGSGVFTLNGDISGTGGLVALGGPGQLVLNGNNSFDLGLDIQAGGTVYLGHNNAAGVGPIIMHANSLLGASQPDLVVGNAIQTDGASRIDSGPGVFTLSGDISGVGSIGSIAGSFGVGSLILAGNNSFSGGLDIASDSLVVLGNNNAAGTGAITLHTDSVLGAIQSGLVIGNAIVTDGVANVLSFEDFTLNGVISGAGAINYTAFSPLLGNLVLNGDNSFTGGLGVRSGRVTLGTNTAAGTGAITLLDQTSLAAGVQGLVLANNVVVESGTATIVGGIGAGMTLNGAISGDGAILVGGFINSLTLNGNNSFTGGLTVAPFNLVTLGTDTAAGTGTIALQGASGLAAGVSGLVIDNAITTNGYNYVRSGPGAGTMTLNGDISGTGSIDFYWPGTLVVNGNNSFTDGMTISGGSLQLGSNTAAGTGTIQLVGATLIAGGPALVLANSIITDGDNRIDSGTGLFAINGSITGTGSITKFGTGTLVLGGASTFTGPTTIGAGRLLVNGSLGPSAVTVNSAATLGGTGTIASFNALAGSFVAPGASVGTLTVTGNATFQAGSTYQVEVQGGAADRLIVGGIAALNGANLAISVGNQPLLFNSSYTILSAAGGRTGTFTSGALTQFGPQFAPTLTYGANDVVLKLVPNSIVTLLGNAASSSNIRNRAAAFDAATSAGFNPQNYFNLFALGSAMAPALNQLTGEIHSIDSRTAMTDTRHVRDAVLDRLSGHMGQSGGQTDAGSAVERDGHRYGIWGRVLGSWGDTKSDGNGTAIDSDTKGLISGVDIGTGNWTLGANIAVLRTNVDTANLGRGKVESVGGGLYGGYRADKGIAAALGGSIIGVTSKASRTTAIPTFVAQTLAAKTKGTSYQAFGEISFDLAASPTAQLEPFARLAYVGYHLDGVNESGGFAAVTSAKAKYDLTVATFGVRGGTGIGDVATIHGSAGYQRTGGDRAATTLLALSGTSSPAAISAVPIDKDAFAGTLGVDFRIGKAATIGLGYSGVIGKKSSDHSANATLTIGF